MVKHNNAIQAIHLRKHWSKFVRTWFNQAARKRRRLEARREKATRLFPRPLRSLRPVVRKQTIRYNTQVRAGRGFSLLEIKKAGLGAAFCRSVGIAVDHRRKNRSVETFNANVQRLLQYKERLILWPRHEGKPKKGPIADSANDQLANLQPSQNTDAQVLAIKQRKLREKAVKITAELQKVWATRPTRKTGKAKKKEAEKKEAEKKAGEAAKKK
eukprot:TRINITY_DN913_c0_g1_i2.p2 TRINITY_DN913_c0_g1~~TRINITY_DN913_c0_g1_i2.p2  ORF type:complete len:214 (+),score=81.07 TRINITY_DN913_c0_g1_i2:131-772(+)